MHPLAPPHPTHTDTNTPPLPAASPLNPPPPPQPHAPQLPISLLFVVFSPSILDNPPTPPTRLWYDLTYPAHPAIRRYNAATPPVSD
ncbi:unnamed protein product [Dicrocoelium dendriticum]|nr:unnamed protein product [Dicrocoelium dendriticum]